MSKAVAVINNNEYRNLPLAQLQESLTNPRRRYNEQALTELAASFATQGILQPLLVRSIGEEKYEVVAGSRRFRAAQLGRLKDVPVRVVALSDAAARENQLTENLLREDVHPYDEALALSGLLHLEGTRHDVSSIASRLGKSPSYILQRIRLKIEKGASKVRRAPLKATIDGTVADDLELMCEWSENDSSYLINLLLAFAIAQSEDFQSYKETRLAASSAGRIDTKSASDAPRKVLPSASTPSPQADKGVTA